MLQGAHLHAHGKKLKMTAEKLIMSFNLDLQQIQIQ